MKINKITSIYNQNSIIQNKKIQKNNISNPILIQNNPISDNSINFKGSYERSNQIQFEELMANFTPDANKIWTNANRVAQKYNHANVGYEHVFMAVLSSLLSHIDRLDKGIEKYGDDSSLFSYGALEEITGCPTLFKDEQKRKLAKPILKKHMKELHKQLLNPTIPKKRRFSSIKPEFNLIAKLNAIYKTNSKAEQSVTFTDDLFLVALNFADKPSITKQLKQLRVEIQKAVMVEKEPEKQKNHLQFYDSIADKIWKNLDLGNDMYVTYENENKDAVTHLLSSFVNLIKKPGQNYSNLNPENTKIVIFNGNTIFDILGQIVEEAKKDPSKTYILVYDLGDVLTTNTLVKGRQSVYLTQDEEKILKNAGAPNVRILLISNKNVYFGNTDQEAPLKKDLEHYGVISIPVIDSDGAKEILGSEKGQEYIKTKTDKIFTRDAIRYIVEIANNQDGYYPEKALNYINKVASYYTDKTEITIDDVEAYEKELGVIQQKQEGQNSELKIVFNTGKKLDDIIGSPMTKAEARSIVNQILAEKKGYVKGFTTFLDNGSSYGGGRKHTAECIAGEAEIPMITINARDFALKDIDALSANANLSEIKIKKLVTAAKAQAEANKNKTAMIYIENFDNFGANPFSGISSIYEQKAFSQLLEEMENLRKKNDINIIIVGSTNYPEVLDENIMKPYKFLNKIIIYSPQSKNDREDLLRYYVRKNNLKIGNNPDEENKILRNAAETTRGFSFVDIIYLLEKADEISRERGKSIIDKADMTEAFLQTTTGRVLPMAPAKHEREITAKHECGHAIALQIMHDIAKKENKPWHLPNEVNFITLDPRGTYGGAMYHKESENDEFSFENMFSEIVCYFGGYSSEKRFYNMDGSLGITQDMLQATSLAKFAVEKMGMGSKTGRISINTNSLGIKDISDDLRIRMESDVEAILKNAETISNKIISAYSGFVEQFTQKYSDKVGTGDCIISSEEFLEQLENWKSSLSEAEKEGLLDLEKDILTIIEKTKKGEIVRT